MPAAGEESNGFVLLPPDEMAKQQAIMEECQGGNSEWFSVGAMFVAFREALEACVIVSVSAAMTPMIPIFCLLAISTTAVVSSWGRVNCETGRTAHARRRSVCLDAVAESRPVVPIRRSWSTS